MKKMVHSPPNSINTVVKPSNCKYGILIISQWAEPEGLRSESRAEEKKESREQKPVLN